MSKHKIHSGLASIDVRFQSDAMVRIHQLERQHMTSLRYRTSPLPKHHFQQMFMTLGQSPTLPQKIDPVGPSQRRNMTAPVQEPRLQSLGKEVSASPPLSFVQDVASGLGNQLTLAKRRIWRC